MSIAHNLKPGLTDKTRAKIMTVDVSNRRVEAGIKDGSMIQVAVWEVSSSFVWPQEGDIWIVRRDNGIWMLDKRVQITEAEKMPINGMSPGDMKLDSSSIFDGNGHKIVAASAQGVSTAMVAGTVTVPCVSIQSTSLLHLTRQAGGTNPGAVYETARVSGTSFTIHSTNASDTGHVAYQVSNP